VSGLKKHIIQIAHAISTGISGGYIKKLSLILPLRKRTSDRCAPQAGQLNPNKSL
jgi:hypothetical protein